MGYNPLFQDPWAREVPGTMGYNPLFQDPWAREVPGTMGYNSLFLRIGQNIKNNDLQPIVFGNRTEY